MGKRKTIFTWISVIVAWASALYPAEKVSAKLLDQNYLFFDCSGHHQYDYLTCTERKGDSSGPAYQIKLNEETGDIFTKIRGTENVSSTLVCLIDADTSQWHSMRKQMDRNLESHTTTIDYDVGGFAWPSMKDVSCVFYDGKETGHKEPKTNRFSIIKIISVGQGGTMTETPIKTEQELMMLNDLINLIDQTKDWQRKDTLTRSISAPLLKDIERQKLSLATFRQIFLLVAQCRLYSEIRTKNSTLCVAANLIYEHFDSALETEIPELTEAEWKEDAVNDFVSNRGELPKNASQRQIDQDKWVVDTVLPSATYTSAALIEHFSKKSQRGALDYKLFQSIRSLLNSPSTAGYYDLFHAFHMVGYSTMLEGESNDIIGSFLKFCLSRVWNNPTIEEKLDNLLWLNEGYVAVFMLPRVPVKDVATAFGKLVENDPEVQKILRQWQIDRKVSEAIGGDPEAAFEESVLEVLTYLYKIYGNLELAEQEEVTPMIRWLMEIHAALGGTPPPSPPNPIKDN